MFKNHQSDDITVRSQIAIWINAVLKVDNVLAFRIIDRFLDVSTTNDKVAHVLLRTVSSRDVPTAPAMFNRCCMINHPGAGRQHRLTAGIHIQGSNEVPGNAFRP